MSLRPCSAGRSAKGTLEVTERNAWNLPPGLSLLSVGNDSQIVALVHFLSPAPERILDLCHFLWRFSRRIGVSRGGDAAGCRLLRHTYRGYGRRSRIAVVDTAILDNPSAANFEELGELYWDEKEYAKAREAFDRAIATRSDSPHSFYRRGLCSMESGEPAAAVADLEHVVRGDPKYDSYRAELMLARAYAATGREQKRCRFSDVVQHSNTPETLYPMPAFLKSQNRYDEARDWLGQLSRKNGHCRDTGSASSGLGSAKGKHC